MPKFLRGPKLKKDLKFCCSGLYSFTCFWLHWVFIVAHRLSLVATSGDYSLLWCGLFIVVARLVEYGLQCAQALVVAAFRLR